MNIEKKEKSPLEVKKELEEESTKGDEKLLQTAPLDEPLGTSTTFLEKLSEQKDSKSMFALAFRELNNTLSGIKTANNKNIPLSHALSSLEDILIHIAPFLDQPSNLLNLNKDVKTDSVLKMMSIQRFGLEYKTKTSESEKENRVLELIRSENIHDLKLLLIDNLLDVNAEIMDSALIIHAIDYGSAKVVGLLLQHHVKTNDIPGLPSDKTLLDLALAQNSMEIVALLLKNEFTFYHIPIGYTFRSGGTLLMKITATGDIALVAKLLRNGRQDEINLGKILTPLYIAIQRFDLDMVDFLLSKKAQINVMPEGITKSPLEFFLDCWYHTGFLHAQLPRNFSNTQAMLKLLLTDEMNINEVSSEKVKSFWTNSDFILVRALISSGASAKDISIQSIYKRLESLIAEARENNDWDTVIFWINLLSQKSEQFFSSLPVMTTITTAAPPDDSDDEVLIPTPNPEENMREELLYMGKSILAIAEAARKKNDWQHIEYFARKLPATARKYFSILNLNLSIAESKRKHRRTSSDLTEDNSFEVKDKKLNSYTDSSPTSLPSMPDLIPTTDPIHNEEDSSASIETDSKRSMTQTASISASSRTTNPEESKTSVALRNLHFIAESRRPSSPPPIAPDLTRADSTDNSIAILQKSPQPPDQTLRG